MELYLPLDQETGLKNWDGKLLTSGDPGTQMDRFQDTLKRETVLTL